jgi:hypothetical protein
MSSPLRTFEGDCHCGALGFAFQTSLPAAEWSVRACQCGFCRAHGARTTSDPSGRLAFRVKRREALQRYRFGLMTADFLLCRDCGIYLGAQIATARGAFGIINTLALEPQPAGLPAASEANYGAETAGERIARREQRWTPLMRPL